MVNTTRGSIAPAAYKLLVGNSGGGGLRFVLFSHLFSGESTAG